MSSLKKNIKLLFKAVIGVVFFFISMELVFKVWIAFLPYQEIDMNKLEEDHYLMILVQDVNSKDLLQKQYKDAVELTNSGRATFKIPLAHGFEDLQKDDKVFTYRYKAYDDNGNLVINVQRVDGDYEMWSRYTVRDGKIIQAARKHIHAISGLIAFLITIFLWVIARRLAIWIRSYLKQRATKHALL